MDYPAFQCASASVPIYRRHLALDKCSMSSHLKRTVIDLAMVDSCHYEHGVPVDCSPGLERIILERLWYCGQGHGFRPSAPTYVRVFPRDVSLTADGPTQRPCSSDTSNVYDSDVWYLSNPSVLPPLCVPSLVRASKFELVNSCVWCP